MRAMSRRSDADAAGVLDLAVGPLEAQVELLLLQVRQLGAQLVGALGAEVVGLGRGLGGGRLLGLGCLCWLLSWPSSILLQPCARRTWSRSKASPAPRRIASLAVARSTPSISNRMRPGLTLATQNSGAPLPEPMRTSAGFLDTGTSGKMRIQTRPARFIWRVMARRAASISRALRRSGSSAFRP